MLEFSLSPENCSKLHDALLCLAKFSDSVSVEARSGQVLQEARCSCINTINRY